MSRAGIGTHCETPPSRAVRGDHYLCRGCGRPVVVAGGPRQELHYRHLWGHAVESCPFLVALHDEAEPSGFQSVYAAETAIRLGVDGDIEFSTCQSQSTDLMLGAERPEPSYEGGRFDQHAHSSWVDGGQTIRLYAHPHDGGHFLRERDFVAYDRKIVLLLRDQMMPPAVARGARDLGTVRRPAGRRDWQAYEVVVEHGSSLSEWLQSERNLAVDRELSVTSDGRLVGESMTGRRGDRRECEWQIGTPPDGWRFRLEGVVRAAELSASCRLTCGLTGGASGRLVAWPPAIRGGKVTVFLFVDEPNRPVCLRVNGLDTVSSWRPDRCPRELEKTLSRYAIGDGYELIVAASGDRDPVETWAADTRSSRWSR
jgi:hypothetical protein